jgi:aspartate/methionine/tyrosine aminotransferase
MSNLREAARLSKIGTSIFATMSALANEYKAVNLGQGFPDFDDATWIFNAALDAMQSGKNQYAPMPGTLSLRKAISGLYDRYYKLDVDYDTEITVTAGATEALFSTMFALIDPGDEVMLFEPYYDSHYANTLLAGGVPKCVTLHLPEFEFDPGELRAAITPRTRILVVNNPHNPTGKVYTTEELTLISELAIEHDLIVISDEVYEFLTFDSAVHTPIAALPGMRERTITISSTGKTFGMTGWKIGYAVAPAALTSCIQKVHQFVTFAVNTPAQHAMANAINRLDEYLPRLRHLYRQKRDILYSGMCNTSFKPHMPLGSYFMMVDIPESAGIDDIECAVSLVKNNGIATIPPSVFYQKSDEGKKMLRLCFAKSDAALRAGIAKLTGWRK